MMGAPWFPRSKKSTTVGPRADTVTAATLVSGGLKKTRNVPVLIPTATGDRFITMT
jgi:hypothetical protein